MSDVSENLLLIGIGGGGVRYVSETISRASCKFRAVVFDSDAQAKAECGGADFHLLGGKRYLGCGAGGNPVKGKTAVQDDREDICTIVQGVRLAIVTTALGGGFGSGATPEILRTLRDQGITVLSIVTMPFSFEGEDRVATARKYYPLVEENSDAIVSVRMDDLYADVKEATIEEAGERAGERIAEMLSLLQLLLAKPGFISMGLERMLSIIAQSGGHCRMATSKAVGDKRATEAVESLLKSPLLKSGNQSEKPGIVLLSVMAGKDLRLAELSDISKAFREKLPVGSSVSFGTVLDEHFEGSIHLIGLFFDHVKRDAASNSGPISLLGEDTVRANKRVTKKDRLSFGGRKQERFSHVPRTMRNGENLDEPTYLRRGIPLDK